MDYRIFLVATLVLLLAVPRCPAAVSLRSMDASVASVTHDALGTSTGSAFMIPGPIVALPADSEINNVTLGYPHINTLRQHFGTVGADDEFVSTSESEVLGRLMHFNLLGGEDNYRLHLSARNIVSAFDERALVQGNPWNITFTGSTADATAVMITAVTDATRIAGALYGSPANESAPPSFAGPWEMFAGIREQGSPNYFVDYTTSSVSPGDLGKLVRFDIGLDCSKVYEIVQTVRAPAIAFTTNGIGSMRGTQSGGLVVADFVLSVPEPSSAGLLGLGILAMARVRRRIADIVLNGFAQSRIQ